jgi:hypothetical protein
MAENMEKLKDAMTGYPLEVLQATERVARIFADGCDRCDREDLDLLESAGLMDRGVCSDTFGQDSLEIGEDMWTFNADGNALADVLLKKSQ